MVKQSADSKLYDCLVLGSGIGGSMLAAILARQGLSVLLIDAEAHPRFAIGESTTPDTNLRMKLLALKYDVPEIDNLSSFEALRDRVSPACGVKRAFSFVYHQEGAEPRVEDMHQYPTLAPPIGADCHFFRQDTDAYLMAVAVRYGAEIRQQTKVTTIDVGDDSVGSEVTLDTSRGERFRGRFLVDATGLRSVLAEKLDLRAGAAPYQTDSRALFTHMMGVRGYDEIAPPRSAHGLPYPLAQGTLHHVFAGGWLWVIPFDNHPDATNPLTSVGLVLDRSVFPERGVAPEVEFRDFLARYPAISRQFEGASAVRPWVATGRLQYGARSIVGPRYCLLAHAGFFLDPLYSSGLALTVATVDLLAHQLIAAVREDDFRVEPFASIDALFARNIPYLDQMVAGSYTSFRDPELWDAWYRLWVVALLVGTELSADAFLRAYETREAADFERSRHAPYNMLLGGAFPEFRTVFEAALATLERVRAGTEEPRRAAESIRALFKELPFVPRYFRWHDRTTRSTPAFTFWGMTKMYLWYRLACPRALRQRLYSWSAWTAYGMLWRSLRESRRDARGRRRRLARDTFFAWNDDWRLNRSTATLEGERRS